MSSIQVTPFIPMTLAEKKVKLEEKKATRIAEAKALAKNYSKEGLFQKACQNNRVNDFKITDSKWTLIDGILGNDSTIRRLEKEIKAMESK